MSHAGAIVLVSGGAVEVLGLGLAAVVLMGLGAWLFLSSRQTPAQRERRRRLTINRTGRMGDATIIDVRDFILYYSYELRGVAYATSQDVSEFQDVLPPETSALIGPAGLKYCPGNPANSIVICEEWSGLRPVTLQIDETRMKENRCS